MSLKKNNFDIIVVGTGLSSLSFIDTYLEKNNKINVISPDFNNNFFKDKYLNSHIDKFLPPQMNTKLKKIKNYFFYNKIIINKNSKIFGSLQFGGLSNYWGFQIDKNISDDIKDLHRNIKTKIQRSFVDIFQKFKLLGEIKINRKIYKRDYKINLFDNIILNKKNSTFNITKPVLAYFKKKSNLEKNVNLELLNEEQIIPKVGLYYVNFVDGYESYKALCNIGHRPTFDNDDVLSIESYVIENDDFNFYGKKIRIEFLKYIRDEIAFASKKELMDQIKNDIISVKKVTD